MRKQPTKRQNSFLFAWNPSKWPWEDLEKNIEELQKAGKVTLRWSCRSHKQVKVGDRAFLVRLGSNPKGIMASGWIVSGPFLSQHWSGQEKDTYRVYIEFDTILNPNKQSILSVRSLTAGQQWTPQSSGISIKSGNAEELEKQWFDFCAVHDSQYYSAQQALNNSESFQEGSPTQVVQTRYERNPHVKKPCLEHYGYSCSVCEFNFFETYGELGEEFIHVHHLTPIASIRGAHAIDPIEDLRPVCPNCHSMLHRRNPPLAIEELKRLIKR